MHSKILNLLVQSSADYSFTIHAEGYQIYFKSII